MFAVILACLTVAVISLVAVLTYAVLSGQPCVFGGCPTVTVFR
jgi:hypothetical protein